VQGGGDTLAGTPNILWNRRALRSRHEASNQLDRYPISNPVAWTTTHQRGTKPARVFTPTLGHPYDFHIPALRRLALQGILWALGKEALIPAAGVDPNPVSDYAPNHSCSVEKYKTGNRPEDFCPYR
jgi:hypothetical protein